VPVIIMRRYWALCDVVVNVLLLFTQHGTYSLQNLKETKYYKF